MAENELQFDRVEGSAGASPCASCQRPLIGSYYQAGGRIFCRSCAKALEDTLHGTEGQAGRVLKATVWGIGGGIAGGAVYAAVLALAHINLALITILIGWLVGKAVRKGAGGRGGRGYQALAVAITYLSIGFFGTLGPVLSSAAESKGLLESALVCIVGAVIGPVLMGMGSILSALITVFGLYEAWKLCGAIHIEVTGPHVLAPVASVAPLQAPPPPRPPPPPPPPSA